MELNTTGRVRLTLTIQGQTFYINTHFTREEWDEKHTTFKMQFVNDAILAAVTASAQMPATEEAILKKRIHDLEQEVARLKKQGTPTIRVGPGVTIGDLPPAATPSPFRIRPGDSGPTVTIGNLPDER
ncbi:putative tail fiber protein [Pseudomonas aeruginosa]|uniref:Uncharacterized protein n=1 Tax=Pseudomonas phage vB_PaeP_MAG4 TaxID=1639814 RepID=A0A172B3Z7_9CAUD|nr:hypothetical protein BIZ95_gp92 [Pseudomonas phage vB_PaeP_MAG4]AKH49535.1 hypothetical protein vB_PaeP_fi6_092 [Pseudomonas phage vB_PaeP_MAG4]SCU73261.1 putative tail fiber protein [Pseudomonas aeruginosa]